MIPKLHKKGSSFKGAALYLLHDKDRASTSERVAWVETRNLPIDEPDIAWRVMAATSMDQARLKASAGIKATGRKSTNSVLHLSLAWHPDEAARLDRAEMIRAAEGAVAALGASDRQAMFVAHKDEVHPHVHVLLNRVSPDDGRMLPSSKEKLRLSAWAEGYERERGQIYCEERVVNNAARARGEFTRASKDAPRHIFELEGETRAASSGKAGGFDELCSAECGKDRELSRKGHDQARRHREQWTSLLLAHAERNARIHEAEQKAVGQAKANIRSRFRPGWRELERSHQDELSAFREREQTLRGRLYNAWRTWRSADLAAEVRGEAAEQQSATSRTFRAIASEGARLEALQTAHAAQRRRLEREQLQDIARVAASERRHREDALTRSRRDFEAERMQLILAQRAEDAKLRAEWRTRNEQRREAFERYRQAQQNDPQLQRAFHQAAQPSRDRDGASDPLAPRVTTSGDGERRIEDLQARLRLREVDRKDREPERER